MGLFIDKSVVESQGWNTRPLTRATPLYNVDGTPNATGPITQEVDLMIHFGEHQERATFCVTTLGTHSIILGHEWLHRHNPDVNWRTGEVHMRRCPKACRRNKMGIPRMVEEGDEEVQEDGRAVMEGLEKGDRLFATTIHNPRPQHVRAVQTVSQRLSEAAMKEEKERALKKEPSLEELIPSEYRDFNDVFSKTSFDELPPRKPWDHAIELKPGSEPKFCKIYPMNPEEQKQLDDFIEENLRTGRIRPSKSPMASPVFFIKKKDGSLRLVQDYRALNEMTIKNKYPLPLISELVNKLCGARYFTALDVRWGYNARMFQKNCENSRTVIVLLQELNPQPPNDLILLSHGQ